MDFLNFVTEVGFPIAAACVGMYFVFLTQKFILDSVLEKVKSLIAIIKQLDLRVSSMSQDILKIDRLLSTALELPKEEDKPHGP
jgi:hypothetical protein